MSTTHNELPLPHCAVGVVSPVAFFDELLSLVELDRSVREHQHVAQQEETQRTEIWELNDLKT